MRKSRNNIRKRRISRRRLYGGGERVKTCPNDLEENLKWKYGDNCYESCEHTSDKTFPASWNDDHGQRRCEADTPENRRRYNLLLPASTAYKGYRVAKDAYGKTAAAVGWLGNKAHQGWDAVKRNEYVDAIARMGTPGEDWDDYGE
jgi:hypothetical protein